MEKRYLILENGRVFTGRPFGAAPKNGGVTGELVFTTGMCGYIETLTDPSYYGQIVLQTFPLIGNYGIIEADFEGKSALFGYVVSEWCESPSNFRSQYTVDEYLRRAGIPGVWGVDTRELTRMIRERGVMNALITDEIPADLGAEIERIKKYAVTDAVRSVTAEKTEFFPAEGEAKYKVALIDYGAKAGIVRELCRRGCGVTAVPSSATAEEILASSPDGVMLSNGPGDPAENTDCIGTIRALLGRVPIFGICLGHQLLALAAGSRTEKLKFGHRGGNQPVRDLKTGRTYITSQNHGYAVTSSTVERGTVSFVNANDGTCEGIDYPGDGAFSVQFHPEARSGPRDTAFLFDRFTAMMEVKKNAEG